MREKLLAAAIAGVLGFAPVSAIGDPQVDQLGEKISYCWNIGALSADAINSTTTVAFYVDSSGHVQLDSIRMLSSTARSLGAGKQAFEAARRAIIRCLHREPLEERFWARTLEVVFAAPKGASVRVPQDTLVET